ncbi:MAG: alpha-galactosidase [Ruminococcaceae bacterium]|nr:alpha-galactosidase [Oscillospiraceae bacterium]
MDFEIIGGNKNAEFKTNKRTENGILFLDIKMILEKEAVPEKFTLRWYFSAADCAFTWNPSMGDIHGLYFDWSKKTVKSRLASWMPLQQIISRKGKNKLLIAVSDVDTPMEIGTGVREEDATLECEIVFFTLPTSPKKEYSATVRIDTRALDYYDSIYDTGDWWENACGYTPAFVPEGAKMPMDSLWYSFHQNLDKDEILKECRASKELGLSTVIIDDGWQTDDNNRGYAYCGDWLVAPGKMGDMAELVENIHSIGMRVMLWYSVPFMGIYCDKYEEFKEMLLDGCGDEKTFFALDPRYKRVREYLVSVYEKAVKEWGLDGLKLDFIDSFVLKGKALDYDENRDYQSLEDAIHALMGKVKERLTAINPEILIEFRQSYVGPSIRKYGNMLRVGDCPCDILKNRFNVVNLRLTSGKTAVHSDMIMWNVEDSVENAALQFTSILYSVPQISVRVDKLPEKHYKMLSFYLGFWKEWRDVLLDGKLTATNPECEYSLVCATLGDKSVFTAYSDRIISVNTKKCVAVNATDGELLVIKNAKNKGYKVLDCTGEAVASGAFESNLQELSVPTAGMVIIGE